MSRKKGTYIVTKSFKTPEVYQTPTSYNSAQIGYKVFRKGDIIKGELKTSNGKPAFLLVGRMTIVPLANIKRLVTKEVVSSVTGESKPAAESTLKKYTKASSNPKIKYMDALLIGAVVGGVGFWALEKRGIINTGNPKHKLYAAGGGALLAFYAVYRFQQSKAKAKIVKK